MANRRSIIKTMSNLLDQSSLFGNGHERERGQSSGLRRLEDPADKGQFTSLTFDWPKKHLVSVKRICKWTHGAVVYGRKVDIDALWRTEGESEGSPDWYASYIEDGKPLLHCFSDWQDRQTGHRKFITISVPLGPCIQLIRIRGSQDHLGKLGLPPS